MKTAQKQAKNNPNRNLTDAHQSSGQNQFAQIADTRPKTIAQRALMDGINDSPRMVAQRRQIEGYSQGNFSTQDITQLQQESARKLNNTGLPDNLKSGIETLSGISMDNVRVHYNSLKPAQLNALAYAQGTDIHLATGQEIHLPHEAWHIVQQKQGRVQPTVLAHGEPINDDVKLEQEAEVMGKTAMQMRRPDTTDAGGGHKAL